MKKYAFSTLLIALSILLISCSFDLPFIGSGNNAPKKDGYIIVSPEDVSEEHYMEYCVSSIRRGLRAGGINEPETITDADTYNGNLYELLVGQTNRPLSDEAYAMLPRDIGDESHVFSVLIKNGDIAICASSETAYKIASKWFSANVVGTDMPLEYSAVMFTTEQIYEAEGNEATCYEISKLYSELFIDGVMLDGTALESFSPGVYEYDIHITVRESIPTLTVSCPAFIKCNVTQGVDTDNPSATATITSKDGKSSATYTFNFIKESESTVMGAKIEKVYGGRDSIVVIVHDDGTKDTVNYMVDQFETHDLVGTIGLIASKIATQSGGTWRLNQAEVSYWQSILNTGRFDIANHSLTHSFWGVSNEAESGYYLDASGDLHEYSFKAGKITDEVVLSKELLLEAFPNEDIMAFIKPGFGRVSDANGTTGMTQISDVAYEIIAEHYIGMRDTGGGVTEIPVPNILKVSSHTVRGTDTAETWMGEVNKAISKNGMLVFLFHTILDDPKSTSLSGKMSETDEFFGWLGEQKADGKVWNTHLDVAMRYVEEYKHATLNTKDYGDRIEVSITDSLDDDIYNHALTVNIPIPEEVTSVVAEFADGSEQTLEIIARGLNRYVLVDIVPDSGTVTLHTN